MNSLSPYPYDSGNHGKQFNHMYFCRLKELQPFLKEKIQSKSSIPIQTVSSCGTVHEGAEVAVTGVIFIDFPNRPNIIDEVTGRSTSNSWKQTFSIYLEDESGKILLDYKDSHSIPITTGLVVGILGRLKSDSVLEVFELILPGLPRLQNNLSSRNNEVVAVICGLPSDLRRLEILKSLLTSPGLTSELKSLIIIGPLLENEQVDMTIGQKRKIEHNSCGETLYSLSLFKNFMDCLSRLYRIYVIPSSTDPTPQCLPLPPINPILFGGSLSPNVSLQSNPSWCDIGEYRIYVSDGKNAEDWIKCSPFKLAPMDILPFLLQSRVVFPTAPDFSVCYPFYERDPFILTEKPHILVTGNMIELKAQDVDGVLSLSVPRFSQSNAITTINLRSCEIKKFELESV